MSKCCKKISCLCVILAMLSIIGSIAIWYLNKGVSSEEIAHAERFGIFVGLWAPTFLGLANYFKGSCCECATSCRTATTADQVK